MPDWFPDWLSLDASVLGWLAAGSVLMLVASAALVPWLATRLPADYFQAPRREERILLRHPVAGLVLLIVKNALGAVLVLAGIAMLVLPGQGVLTILAGLTLMNFPGKYRVERWLMSRPAVFNAVNWLRRRAGRPPLEL